MTDREMRRQMFGTPEAIDARIEAEYRLNHPDEDHDDYPEELDD